MAGAPPPKGSHAGFNSSLDQHTYYHPSTAHLDHHSGGHLHNSYGRDRSATRGRVVGPPVPQLSIQSQPGISGRAISPRSNGNGSEPPSRPGTSGQGSVERKRSTTHSKQSSLMQGPPHHSRNSSLAASSPAYSHRSPHLTSPAQNGGGFDAMSHSALPLVDPYEYRSPASASSTTIGSFSTAFTTSSTLASSTNGDLTSPESERHRAPQSVASPPSRPDRSFHSQHPQTRQPASSRREHGHSKSKTQSDQVSVSDFAMEHLCETFEKQADLKINDCARKVTQSNIRIEDLCGPGVDPDFDLLISSMGHVARHKPRGLVDKIMYWRRFKSEANQQAHAEWNAVRVHNPFNRHAGPTSAGSGDLDPNAVHNQFLLTERKLTLSIYLICRVLIEIYQQTDLEHITNHLDDKLEDLIFEQVQRLDPEKLSISPFLHANWTIYSQLLGVMSSVSFTNVSSRFVKMLRPLQEETNTKGNAPREPDSRLELQVRAMKHVRIRTQPDFQWKESCDFLYQLGKMFVNSHGQPIKHAYCQILETLVVPAAATHGAHVNAPRWKDFLGVLNPRLSQMLTKPRHWPESFPLYVILLCASPSDVFFGQWTPVVNACQAKLKDRVTRSLALQAICRLTWTFLSRSSDSMATVKKLEEMTKIVLPAGKKSFLSTEPIFAEPIIEFIRLIGYRFPDFCFRTILFPLVNSELFNSPKEVRVEQLEPERLVVGIRAFLAVIGDLENPNMEQPPFPAFKTDPHHGQAMGPLEQRPTAWPRDEKGPKPIHLARLDDATHESYNKFCEILSKITIICDNTFGGQATIDEKLGGQSQTPKTPITESFSFSRKDDSLANEQRNGFYELFHTAVQALPRCLENTRSPVPFTSLLNLLCTGTAHIQPYIARSSATSLKSVARHSHAQKVADGFARFIFNYDSRYSTMSDDGLLGPGHIQSTLQLYLDLLKIWVDEIKQKAKAAPSIASPIDGPTKNRSVQLDVTNAVGFADTIEAHGLFFLCSQSRKVRTYAISVLRLVTEFDATLGRDNQRIISILEGDVQQVISPDDDRLTLAERSRLQKGRRKSSPQNTLVELCRSDGSYDYSLWLKVFPGVVRLSFEQCQMAVTLSRDLVCARLAQMLELIHAFLDSTKSPQIPGASNRAGSGPPEFLVEQFKIYLIMACTTITNRGAQTQSQLQHTRNKSSKESEHGKKTISSARNLFANVIPCLGSTSTSIRDSIVTALGSININLYRILLESLEYAVIRYKDDAKSRVGPHQRSGSGPRRNRDNDRLRTEVAHIYKLTSRFLHHDEVLRDEWILAQLIKYTDDMRIFLSDADVQSDWEFQPLRQHYCGLLEEVFEGINRRPDPVRWMSFEARKAAFALMEEWCGYSPDQTHVMREDTMPQPGLGQLGADAGNATTAVEIQKRALKQAALSAMASLCGGPISIVIDRNQGQILTFDVRRIISWIDQIFDTPADKMHIVGQKALNNLILHNKSHPKLLEHAIDMCFTAERPKALESYFEVVSSVLIEHEDYQVSFWRVLGAMLFTLGNDKSAIRTRSARLLRVLELRQQRNSKIQDFDISISDRTTAVYKLAQFEICKRLSKQHSDVAFHVFSQFCLHYKTIHASNQRNMIHAILPWIQVIELSHDPNGGPTAPSYMFLTNLLEITTRSSTSMHNEIQALWQALATGPHGGNVQVVLDFVISLCIERREQSFVDYARQIVVFLSSTPAGQKVVEFLLLQINPRNMVHTEKKPLDIPQDTTGLPYIADIKDALPIGNKQSGFSLGQTSLILLVDLMVAPVKLTKDQVPLLLQVCLVLWDYYNPLVQEQAREMLVHLIHELVIAKFDDETPDPKKKEVEEFIDAVRQSKSSVTWTYHEGTGKDKGTEDIRVPSAMRQVCAQVITLFTPAYPNIHEQWAKTTLQWANSCPVRHFACRSFQIFRCTLTSLDQGMLADMLARLSNTIADQQPDVQSFSIEILETLTRIITALERLHLLNFPQLFWVTCACLNTVNETEFIESLGMLDILLTKVDLSDPAVVKILTDHTPQRWAGEFGGIMPLVYRGLKSSDSLEKTLLIIGKTLQLPDNDLLGVESRLLFCTLACLPTFFHSYEVEGKEEVVKNLGESLVSIAESDGSQEMAMVLQTFTDGRYTARKDFLNQIMSTIKQAFFPTWQVQSLIFMIGLLSNKLPWMKSNVLETLYYIIPSVDIKNSLELYGPQLVTPVLQLLTTEHCSKALQVMDLITAATGQTINLKKDPSGHSRDPSETDQSRELYGTPSESGWSIPSLGKCAKETRENVHAVFYTCAPSTSAASEADATPEIEFDSEDSYFPAERTATMTSEDARPIADIDGQATDMPLTDLVSKLDSLDDFFGDEYALEDKYQSSYSDITITGYTPNLADLDPEPAPYEQPSSDEPPTSLSYKPSLASLSSQNPYHSPPASFETRPHPAMNPTAFSNPPTSTSPLPLFNNLYPPSAPPPSGAVPHPPTSARPTMHARSITSPSNPAGASSAVRASDHHPHLALVPDLELGDDLFSDDERSTAGYDGAGVYETIVQKKRSAAVAAGGAGMPTRMKVSISGDGKERRQGDLLRGGNRMRKAQGLASPVVPKVPQAFLASTAGKGVDG